MFGARFEGSIANRVGMGMGNGIIEIKIEDLLD